MPLIVRSRPWLRTGAYLELKFGVAVPWSAFAFVQVRINGQTIRRTDCVIIALLLTHTLQQCAVAGCRVHSAHLLACLHILSILSVIMYRKGNHIC